MKKLFFEVDRDVLRDWFRKEGFQRLDFNGEEWLIVHSSSGGIVNKLFWRSGFDLFYKEVNFGAIAVFEVNCTGTSVIYDCYCPVYLFKIWPRKWQFRKKRGLLGYLNDGYLLEEQFIRFLKFEY